MHIHMDQQKIKQNKSAGILLNRKKWSKVNSDNGKILKLLQNSLEK